MSDDAPNSDVQALLDHTLGAESPRPREAATELSARNQRRANQEAGASWANRAKAQ